MAARIAMSKLLLLVGLLMGLFTGTPALAHIADFTVDGDADLALGGTAATVTGVIVCDVGEEFFVSALIFEALSKGSAVAGTGSGGPFACTGAPQLWSLGITVALPVGAAFKPGPGIVLGFADSSDPLVPGHFDSTTLLQTIHLRK